MSQTPNLKWIGEFLRNLEFWLLEAYDVFVGVVAMDLPPLKPHVVFAQDEVAIPSQTLTDRCDALFYQVGALQREVAGVHEELRALLYDLEYLRKGPRQAHSFK